jgi:hypothetical protein
MLHPTKREIYVYFWTIIYDALANEHLDFLQPVCKVTENREQFLYQGKKKELFFLGTSVKLLKATVSFVMERLRSHWSDFLEIWCAFFEKSREISSLIKILQK